MKKSEKTRQGIDLCGATDSSIWKTLYLFFILMHLLRVFLNRRKNR